MSGKVKIIIAILLCILVGTGGFYFLQQTAKQKVIAEITESLKKIDDKAEISHGSITIDGFMKAEAIHINNLNITSDKYKATIAKLSADIADNQPTKLSISDSAITIEKKQVNQTGLSYSFFVTDIITVNIKYSPEGKDFTVNLPDILGYKSSLHENLIKFDNKSKIAIAFDASQKLKTFNYSDEGIKIYKDSVADENLVSTSNQNIIKIDKKVVDQIDIYDINIVSSDNKLVIQNNNNPIQNTLFNFALISTYTSTQPKTALKKTISLKEFSLKFPKFNIEMSGELTQDWQNLVPFGSLNLKSYNYKFFLNRFFNTLESDTSFEDHGYLKSYKESKKQQQNLITFLEKINGNSSNSFDLTITRNSADMPVFNNLTFKKVTSIYKDVFNIPATHFNTRQAPVTNNSSNTPIPPEEEEEVVEELPNQF